MWMHTPGPPPTYPLLTPTAVLESNRRGAAAPPRVLSDSLYTQSPPALLLYLYNNPDCDTPPSTSLLFSIYRLVHAGRARGWSMWGGGVFGHVRLDPYVFVQV